MLASGVFAGVFTPDFAYSRADRDGKTFGDELKRIGYQGSEKAGARKFSAMFELHIEQGPILEDEGRMIGIVQGVQGMRWYEVTVTGQEAHTGATPMRLRKNALLGAARLIDRINAIALEHAPNAVGSVGLIKTSRTAAMSFPARCFSPSISATRTTRCSILWKRNCGRRSQKFSSRSSSATRRRVSGTRRP